MNVDRLGSIDLAEVKYVEADRDLRIVAGDVLFNNTNSPPLIGKTAYFDRPGEWAFSNHMTRLRPPLGLEPKFLAIQLHFLWSRGLFQELCSHHVNQASVSTRRLLEAVRLVVPPTEEQKRIVAVIEEHFSRLDAAEKLLMRARSRLVRLRDIAMNRAFAGDWAWASTGEVAEVQGGIQKQPKRRPVNNKASFLRVANVLRGRLDLADVHEVELFEGELDRYRLMPGDLLVVEGNGSIEQIGRCALWRNEIANCVHQNHLIRVRPGPGVLPAFLNAYWNSPTARQRLAEVASSTSGLYTLSTAKVKAVPVPIVPLAEQQRIVSDVDRQLSIIEAQLSAIDTVRRRSTALRRSILELAFTGELVPQDPSDEPASVLLEWITAERAAAPKPSRRKGKIPT